MNLITADDPIAKSADVARENIEGLRSIFPEAFGEGKIDFDVLKQLLGGEIDDRDEKYGLNWHGKRQARQLALTPSTGTLRPAPEDSVDWDSTQNLMIEGDNLEVLKLLQKSYSGKVKLIYIDPPYNRGSDFVYKDNFRDTIRNYKEITAQIEGGANISSNPETSGRFHTDWLNMMYPRLKIAKDLLAKSGAIFISLDDHEMPRFRLLADEIFGEENFLATIVWEKVHTRKNSSKTFSISHDYIVAYAREWEEWDRILLPREGPSAYKNPDDDPKGPWKPDPITAHNPYSADYVIEKPNGTRLGRPEGRYWAFSEETWLEKVANEEVIWGKDDAYPMIKRYLSDVQDGLVPVTLFDRKFAGDSSAAKKEVDGLFEAQGIFDYPKPTKLIQRIIQIGAKPNDIVLDFFAGSGTTAHAVMRQNSKDDGQRRYIMVQLPEPLDADNSDQENAANFCDRIDKPCNIAELTKERLRRAAKEIQSQNPDYDGDLGFRDFKLDSSNIRAWEPAPDDLDTQLLEHVDHIRDNRSEHDVLCELLLKLGLDLCVPIETRKIAGKAVQSVGYGTLFVSLEDTITQDDAEELARGVVAWRNKLDPAGDTTVVFLDSSFVDDVAKTNLAAILEQHGIETLRSL